MQHKREQLESTLQKAVSQIVAAGLSDPRVRGLISVTKVKVNSETHEASIFVSVLPEEHQKMTIDALNHAISFFRSEINKKVRIRRVPRLRFKADDSLKKQARVLDEIKHAVDEDQSRSSGEVDSPLLEEGLDQ